MKRLSYYLVFLTLLLTACGNFIEQSLQEFIPSESTEKSRANLMEVPLLYVIDGDTIKVKMNGKEESVRFLLIDTPETSHPELGKQPYGEEAKAFTQQLLSGNSVLLEKDVSERDKYGRLLMYVYTPNGKSVQEALLEEGLARVAYVYAPNIKYVDHYRELEKEAQQKGIGIWALEGYAHIGHEHGYHTEVFKDYDQDESRNSSSSFEPDENGDCDGLIKGNHSSSGELIFHVPDGSYYQVTNAEMCFSTKEAAIAAGYRQSKS